MLALSCKTNVETCGQKHICWLYPAKQLLRPLVKADSRCMLSEIFVKKEKEKKEKVHLWCEPSPCAQKYLQKTEKEKVHLWCEPSPGLVRPSVVFVARRHFDIVVELDYLQKFYS